MTYKLLVVDLDGTLLRRDGAIDESDREAIERLKAAGVPSAIATGRLYSGTRHIARQASIAGPVACVDGSHIVDARDDRGLFSRCLAGEHALTVRSVLDRRAPAGFLFAQDSVVYDPRGEPFINYVRSWSTNISAVDRVTAHPYWEHEAGVHAVVAVGTEEQIRGSADEVQAAMPDEAFVLWFPVERRSGMFAMIVRAAGSSKGTAIEWLSAHYGCDPSEVVVVGDWLNDVPMFLRAGRSFVMAQAPAHVKAAATDRLEAHASRGGGIAEAVRRAWGKL
ncbi:MAG: Cof-type HAD-IIB family hydrolase [Polyangiaceae bacterium]|nr:Cof-type HAD-IIB family hydrolase [Polyangiaceae bacterium]